MSDRRFYGVLGVVTVAISIAALLAVWIIDGWIDRLVESNLESDFTLNP